MQVIHSFLTFPRPSICKFSHFPHLAGNQASVNESSLGFSFSVRGQRVELLVSFSTLASRTFWLSLPDESRSGCFLTQYAFCSFGLRRTTGDRVFSGLGTRRNKWSRTNNEQSENTEHLNHKQVSGFRGSKCATSIFKRERSDAEHGLLLQTCL